MAGESNHTLNTAAQSTLELLIRQLHIWFNGLPRNHIYFYKEIHSDLYTSVNCSWNCLNYGMNDDLYVSISYNGRVTMKLIQRRPKSLLQYAKDFLKRNLVLSEDCKWNDV